MLIFSLILLLLSNSLTMRRDKAILYSRITIILLIFCYIISIHDLYIDSLEKGIGLYDAVNQARPITHIFYTFIFLLTGIILNITAFYPKKICII